MTVGPEASPGRDTAAGLDGEGLLARQYAGRPHLRPVLDAVLHAAAGLGEVRVEVRRTQVSLVGPRRTFAIVQATTRRRVDVALRLRGVAPGGRARPMRGEEYTVRLELASAEDVDEDALGWLRRAYDVNAAPLARRAPAPRPRLRGNEPLHLVIEGVDLPGSRCNPDAGGHVYTNVHVGLRTSVALPGAPRVVPAGPRLVAGAVRADAPHARWDVEATLRRYDAEVDVTGPEVAGRRGDRRIGLLWGEVTEDGTFVLFRGLGLRLADIDPALLDEAARTGGRLVGRLRLTDAKGNPRCASVRPPDVTWSVAPPGTGAPARPRG